MVLSDKMAIKELKSIDLSSYTIISTGVATLISIVIAIIIVGLFAVSVPNSFGVMIYIFPTIVFGTMISNIFVNFSTGYLYNVLSKRLGFIKFDIEEDSIKSISAKETGLLVGFITLIMILVMYLATSLILPLILSSFMTLLMYSAQTGIATVMYQTMMLISNPMTIAVGILGSVIIVSVFTLLGVYIYNILASSNREILVKLSEKNNLTQLDSITPLNFAIAIGAISLILNIIIAAILVISSVPIFNALVDVLIGFVCAFIAAMLIALSYNFLAPKLGKLKVELE
ncbi:hypothetical protein sm9_0164 [Methanobrevibacter millerae]|uniref:Uncharacterized protein n=2 Tax=Methanobrevibacter millerae TaxID=230361 RepID=A0A0U2SG62_9EURY|nr:hypothetical protein sm9_0164 [Methanobrevibacter millerae]